LVVVTASERAVQRSFMPFAKASTIGISRHEGSRLRTSTNRLDDAEGAATRSQLNAVQRRGMGLPRDPVTVDLSGQRGPTIRQNSEASGTTSGAVQAAFELRNCSVVVLEACAGLRIFWRSPAIANWTVAAAIATAPSRVRKSFRIVLVSERDWRIDVW